MENPKESGHYLDVYGAWRSHHAPRYETLCFHRCRRRGTGIEVFGRFECIFSAKFPNPPFVLTRFQIVSFVAAVQTIDVEKFHPTNASLSSVSSFRARNGRFGFERSSDSDFIFPGRPAGRRQVLARESQLAVCPRREGRRG
jgi:hypothetical protein